VVFHRSWGWQLNSSQLANWLIGLWLMDVDASVCVTPFSPPEFSPFQMDFPLDWPRTKGKLNSSLQRFWSVGQSIDFCVDFGTAG